MDNQVNPSQQQPQQPAPKKPGLLKRMFRPLFSWMHILSGKEESLDLLNQQDQSVGAGQQQPETQANSQEFEVKRSLHFFFILQLLMLMLKNYGMTLF